MKLDAKGLRVSEPKKSDVAKLARRKIYIICDNILDTYNIGSIFRLADAVAAQKIYLCGKTQTPPYHRISKAAVGTDKWVTWEHASTAVEAISNLKSQIEKFSSGKANLRTIAIEQSPKSVDYRKANYQQPIAFVVGHETTGVSKEALKLADQVVELSMFGVNRSLNVMVSLAIVLYQAISVQNLEIS